ncbi:MAG TPA: ABC transporter ATP-binding protein [Gammaproteobacteria bacterium]|nr:ABC transporter ATP-binding protein [Gammaproteobacteria bacterium]
MTTLTLENVQWGPNPRSPLSLVINTGEVWVILGQNGSGKTTLLHTLMGLLPPTSGHILINKQALHHHSAKARAKMLGLLFQTHHPVFPISIEAYCKDARYPHGKESTHTINQHASHALNALGLTPLKHQTLNTLSGGERQRAALAALLVQDPRFYLLDEPMNHLDLAHQIKALQHFTALANDDRGLIISLHNPTQAEQIATHALLLFNDGSHAHGRAATLFTEPMLSRLYECKLQRNQHREAVFWQAEMCYNEVTSLGRDE